MFASVPIKTQPSMGYEGTVFSLLFDVLEIVGDIPGIPFRKRTRYRRPQPNPWQ